MRRSGTNGAASGVVLGVPGGGLVGAGRTWAKNDEVAETGRQGEIATAEVLARLASAGNATVLHDLVMQRGRYTVNVDHVIVTGRRVLIVDSKRWRPGFYWTFSGRTWRAGERFPFADKHTMSMLVEMIERHLRQQGVKATVLYPVVVVWPSSDRIRLRTWAMRFPGARVITGQRLERFAGKLMRSGPADPQIVRVLAELMSSRGGTSAPAGRHAPRDARRRIAPRSLPPERQPLVDRRSGEDTPTTAAPVEGGATDPYAGSGSPAIARRHPVTGYRCDDF